MWKTGDAIDRYVVEAVLGEGGMGTVYRARDTKLDRRVALKVVRAERLAGEADRAKATERLLREARAAAAFHHPNAVAIFDVGEVDGLPFLAMELVAGRTMRALVSDESVSWRDSARRLVDVAKALAGAHKAGLVHRDVKPENVMVDEDGHVKVLDFGIARRSSSGAADPSAPTQAPLGTLTAEGVTIGTPFYMAPEQIKGDAIDARADQFSWGVLAYEVLAHKLPWRTNAETLGAVASILTETPPPLSEARPEIPREVSDVIARALAKSPGDRFPSMTDAARALDEALEGRPATSTPPPPKRDSARDGRRWSDDEMKQILDRAMREEPATAGIGYETMVAAAREVGIDERAIERAVREQGLTKERFPKPVVFDEAEWRRRSLRRFLRHVLTFLAVQAFLFTFLPWGAQKWAFFGWGLGIVTHGIRTFLGDPPDPERWARRQQQKIRHQGRRKDRKGDRVDDGVSELMSTAERLALAQGARARVEPHGKVRVRDEREEAAALEADVVASERREERR